MHRNIFAAILYFTVLLPASGAFRTAKSPGDPPPKTGTSKPSASAVTQWRNQKFSMFIHFGVYSVAGGTWKNKKVTKGYSEQIRAHAKISREDYHALARSFNPVNWNPDSVAALAKAAGMKSIVITAKHHDGFAMYHTRYSKFNIVDATPYKQDIIKGLAAACKRQGLRFGVYFSLIDWDFPGAVPISDHNSDSIPPLHHQLNLRQVKELITRYGPVSEIWFDMGKPTLQQSRELAQLVRKYQPGCLISGRLWNDQGDFAVMGDNASPDFKMGAIWQTPASMFDETWGYRSWQLRGDPKEKAIEKLTGLIKVVSNGGNYLLNIGPMGDGSIVPFERKVLSIIGTWFQRNREAIYGTSPSPLPGQEWGVITSKPGKLFLFIQKAPEDGKIIIRGLRSKPLSAYLLPGKSKPLIVSYIDGEPALDISNMVSEGLIKVIAIEYKGQLEYVPPKTVARSEGGSYELTSSNAIKYHSYSGQDYYTTRPTVIKMEWVISDAEEGRYNMILRYSPGNTRKKLRITINGKQNEVMPDINPGAAPGTGPIPRLSSIALAQGKLNTIQISLADQTDPHKDMEAEGLVIRLEK